MTVDFSDFKTALRAAVLADEAVQSLIDDRFYGAQLATLYNPSFPNVCFFAGTGKLPVASIIWQFPLELRAYSEKHYDEAHEVYKTVTEILDNEILAPRIVIRPITNPIEHFMETSRMFGVYGKFNVTWIP